MAYTVKQLAKMSGVTVRTLHFYDEVGLLKPASYGANGYRYYEQKQLLVLQQILFFRELGFELKQIHRVLGRPDFDQLAALASHRQVLLKDLNRARRLLQTIDKTIEHLKGKQKMKDNEMYWGFSHKKQTEHEQYLIDRYGDKMKTSIAESHKKTKKWTKADWERAGQEFDQICRDLAGLIGRQLTANSNEAQNMVRRHYQWLKHFWIPTQESYSGHAQLIVDSELRKAYEPYHPRLAEFLAEGVKIFAAKELT
jgi:DNA-binding transcriptional MerR regulator